MLARLPQHIGVEVITLIEHLKSSIVDTLIEKFKWTKTIPYRAIVIWLCVIDKITVQTAQRIYADCINEYDTLFANKGAIHRVAHLLFQPNPEMRRLGELWIHEGGAPLSAYPLLFETIFYYAFILLVELAVEGEHKKISDVLSHPGRKQEAPAVCATMRFPQVQETSRDEGYDAWAARMFKKRNLLSDVLTNICNEPERKRLRKAENRTELVNRIYSAGRKDHFEDISDVTRSLITWNRGQRALQPLALKPIGAQSDFVDYIKHRFSTADAVFTLPLRFLNTEAFPDDGAAINNHDDLYDSLAHHAVANFDQPVDANSQLGVFQVINAFPEKRSIHNVSHFRRNEWLVHINYFGTGDVDASRRLRYNMARPKRKMIDLRIWIGFAGDLSFKELLAHVVRWQDIRGMRHVELPNLETSLVSVPAGDVDTEACHSRLQLHCFGKPST